MPQAGRIAFGRMEAVTFGKPAAEVYNPGNYLFRAALNAALDNRRSEKRHLTAVEIDSLIELPDETPDPVRVAEGRSAIRRLEAILAELPPRLPRKPRLLFPRGR